MRESLVYSDADDVQWAVTRNASGITVSRRTNVAHTRFAGTWEAVDVADAPAVVRAVVAVWTAQAASQKLSDAIDSLSATPNDISESIARLKALQAKPYVASSLRPMSDFDREATNHPLNCLCQHCRTKATP